MTGRIALSIAGQSIVALIKKYGGWWFLGWGAVFLAACAPSQDEKPTAAIAEMTAPSQPVVVTRTIQPTQESANTATPEPTPLPIDTPLRPTPTPTISPSPTATVTPYSGPLPPLGHDLLLLAEGSLKLWNHETGQLEVLLLSTANGIVPDDYPYALAHPGAIREFSVSFDGQTIAASRVVTGDPLIQELIWLNLATGESQLLAAEVPYMYDISVSPDGRRVAYISEDPETFADAEGTVLGTVFMQEVGGDEPAVPIGYCLNVDDDGEERQDRCIGWGIVWSPDGNELLWADERGVMSYNLSSSTEVLLQPNNYDLPESFQLYVYMPIDWSPSGRFLRLDVGHYEGGSEAVLDLETRHLYDIPHTFNSEGPPAPYVTWLADDRLLLVRPEGPYGEFSTLVEIWSVSLGNDTLILDGSVTLPTSGDTIPKPPIQLADGSLALAVLGREPTDTTAGLYRLESLNSVPEQLNQVPELEWIWYGNELYWEPDGNGALIFDPEYPGSNMLIYMPVGESVFFDLIPIVGDSIREVYWLP